MFRVPRRLLAFSQRLQAPDCNELLRVALRHGGQVSEKAAILVSPYAKRHATMLAQVEGQSPDRNLCPTPSSATAILARCESAEAFDECRHRASPRSGALPMRRRPARLRCRSAVRGCRRRGDGCCPRCATGCIGRRRPGRRPIAGSCPRTGRPRKLVPRDVVFQLHQPASGRSAPNAALPPAPPGSSPCVRRCSPRSVRQHCCRYFIFSSG